MASPLSLLQGARAFARDFPRDRIPTGFLWDVSDYVPMVIDATLTGRGGWQWGSTVMGGDAMGGILAGYMSGDKLLFVANDGHWYEVLQTPPYTATQRGTSYAIKQNPIKLVDTVIAFDAAGAGVPQLVTAPGGTLAYAYMDATAPKAPLGAAYKGYLVVGGTPGEENLLRFARQDQLATAWDTNAFLATDTKVTGIGALRSVIIVFHAGSTERIRDAQPPHSGAQLSDPIMFTEPLFARVGCPDPRAISYWNDNCIFADEHGCHITDGAVIRNLVSQGNILMYWRSLYANQTGVSGCCFLDYYIVTVQQSSGPAVTLICDLNRRQWFRFTNVYASNYVSASGGLGMERVWACMVGTKRLARIGPVFFPVLGGAAIQDDDGTPVLPAFETPWYRLADEGRKRARFAYLSYDARTSGAVADGGLPSAWRAEFGSHPDGQSSPGTPAVAATAPTPVLELGFITEAPTDQTYVQLQQLPATDRYTRYRLPIWRGSYGVGFRVRQIAPTTVTRIDEFAVDGLPMERSRL
jgi:hypothetical protein